MNYQATTKRYINDIFQMYLVMINSGNTDNGPNVF